MKSKHCTYGEEIALCNFNDYHTDDNFLHKNKVTAIAVAVTFKV